MMDARNASAPPGQSQAPLVTFPSLSAAASTPVADDGITLSQKMLSAVSGSILTSLLVTPLDVVRVRLQSQQPQAQPPPSNGVSNFSLSGARQSFTNLPPNLGVTACCREVFWVNNNAAFCVAPPAVANVEKIAGPDIRDCVVEDVQKKNFTSTFDGLKKIARNEGFTTLWRGLSPTLVMAVPGNVIYFAGYDWLRVSPQSPLKGRVSDAYAPLLAGSSARVLAALFVSPIELFRTRMQASHASSAGANFRETLHGVKDMVSTQGYHTLWRGLSMTLWRDVPFSAFYWWGYEATRNALLDFRGSVQQGKQITSEPLSKQRGEGRARQDNTSTLVDSFIAGAFSGGIASVVTTPFDVGKTRQQVYQHAGDSASSAAPGSLSIKPQDQSMPRLLWHIFKTEGAPGLFRGWAARCLKVAPACAIMISSYEIGKKMAISANKSRDE